jgi:hypothetical protein
MTDLEEFAALVGETHAKTILELEWDAESLSWAVNFPCGGSHYTGITADRSTDDLCVAAKKEWHEHRRRCCDGFAADVIFRLV